MTVIIGAIVGGNGASATLLHNAWQFGVTIESSRSISAWKFEKEQNRKNPKTKNNIYIYIYHHSDIEKLKETAEILENLGFFFLSCGLDNTWRFIRIHPPSGGLDAIHTNACKYVCLRL